MLGGRVSDYRVLYMVGPGRSGSTVIGEILGQSQHVANGGELLLWWMARQSSPARRCGCGERLDTCEFWTKVSQVHPALSSPDPAVVAGLYRFRRFSTWPGLWWKSRNGQVAAPQVTELMVQLYDAIALVSGSSVIVDSSKSPGYRLLLFGSNLQVQTLQLQRDPRSVVNSWRHEKRDPTSPGDSLFAIHPLRSTVEWIAQTLATRWFIAPRLRPHGFTVETYEDFVQHPRRHTESLLAFAGLDERESLFHDDTHIHLEPTHNLAGNPGRRGATERQISLHERWPDELPTSLYLFVTVACAPWLSRYRYRFSRRSSS